MHVSSLRRVRDVVLLAGLAMVVASGFLPAPHIATASSQSAQVQDVGDGGTADDAVRRILLATPPVPQDIFELRQRLEAQGVAPPIRPTSPPACLMDQLLTDRANQGGGGQSLKQQLRSLFTTMEINLVSDRVPLTERERQNGAVELPQDCFVDSRLVGKREAISVPLTLYKEALTQVGSRIAPGETPGLVETHHAFLVPARSYGDNQMIETLMQQGMLDEELVADVLAVDFATPVFSPAPASLMRSEEHHKSQCTSLVQPIRAWCTLYNAFFSELHTSIVYVQRVAKPPLPASITWTALPAGRPIRGKEV